MTPRIGRTIGGFHHRLYQFLMGMQPYRYAEGRREHFPFEASMEAAVLEEVETYVLRLHNTIAQYIMTCTM